RAETSQAPVPAAVILKLIVWPVEYRIPVATAKRTTVAPVPVGTVIEPEPTKSVAADPEPADAVSVPAAAALALSRTIARRKVRSDDPGADQVPDGVTKIAVVDVAAIDSCGIFPRSEICRPKKSDCRTATFTPS